MDALLTDEEAEAIIKFTQQTHETIKAAHRVLEAETGFNVSIAWPYFSLRFQDANDGESFISLTPGADPRKIRGNWNLSRGLVDEALKTFAQKLLAETVP